MDKCTHEVRKQYWKNIIGQCLQRPEGMTAKQWLDENCKYRQIRAHCTVVECMLSGVSVHAFRYIVHVHKLAL